MVICEFLEILSTKNIHLQDKKKKHIQNMFNNIIKSETLKLLEQYINFKQLCIQKYFQFQNIIDFQNDMNNIKIIENYLLKLVWILYIGI